MSDEELKARWDSVENENINKACDYLRGYEREIGNNLAKFVASLCDITVDEMFGNTKSNYCSQARWLYWFALRYMTDETYDKIALRTANDGRKFTLRAVAKGIEKMNQMVDSNSVWKKRWTILKRIIKMYNSKDSKSIVRVVITRPAGVNVEVEFKNE